MIEFEVIGEVVPKGRPRFSKYGSTYTPEKTKNYENWVKICYLNKYKDFKPLEGRLQIGINVFIQIPSSKPKKVQEEMRIGKISPTKKPDVDNIVKGILDALNKVAYIDDKQIVALNVVKQYSYNPKAIIRIWEF